MELTLSPAVTSSDNGITLSYAKGNDANPLQSPSGDEVADFSGQQVINNGDTTAPTVQSAAVDGATLTLTFNEALKTTSEPDAPDKDSFEVDGTASSTSVTAVGFKSGDAKSVEADPEPGRDRQRHRAHGELHGGGEFERAAAGLEPQLCGGILRAGGDEQHSGLGGHDGPDGGERDGQRGDADADLRRGAEDDERPRHLALHRGRGPPAPPR